MVYNATSDKISDISDDSRAMAGVSALPGPRTWRHASRGTRHLGAWFPLEPLAGWPRPDTVGRGQPSGGCYAAGVTVMVIRKPEALAIWTWPPAG
jgi:hypothetical protein